MFLKSIITSLLKTQINLNSCLLQPAASIAMLLGIAIVAHAVRPGDLDRRFGNNGVVTTTHLNLSDVGRGVIQPDGKAIKIGQIAGDFYVARFNVDGSFDTSFDGDGQLTIPVSTGDDAATGSFVQPDGKIVICGISRTTGFYDFAIVRLHPNGTLDNSLDQDGIRITSVSNNHDFAQSVTVMTDGRIVVVGQAMSGQMNMTVVRYNSDGSFDNTFDQDGIATVIFPEGASTSADVNIQSDGKILLAGAVGLGGQFLSSTFGVARLLTTGLPDTSFGGGDGSASLDVRIGAPQQNSAERLLLLPDGKIIVAGNSNSGLNASNDFALVKLNSDGTTDGTFGNGGKVITTVGPNDDFVRSVAMQADGKLLVGGIGRTPAAGLALVRYRTDGSLDPQFGNAGVVFVPAETDYGISLLQIQSDGFIRAISFDRGNSKFARFFQFGQFFADFDGDTRTDIGIFRPGDGTWWINRSSNGSIFAAQFGAATDKIAPADFTGDGKTDIAIWRPSNGTWFVLRSEDSAFYAFPFGTDGDIPIPADYDYDGIADPTVYRPAFGVWFILGSRGSTRIEQFGLPGDVPVAADYDADGKADIAIYRPSNGQWWVNRSSAGLVALAFGDANDKPTQGDFTGDGKADIAFWRPSTGGWFILRSEDFLFFAFPFGSTGDIPAPGDYDGDGKFDATVFRPSEGNWYVLRSTAGTLIHHFGVSGDRPVANAFVP